MASTVLLAMNIEANQLVQKISAKAIQLVHKYYACLDNYERREEWLSFFVPIPVEHPVMIWNGHVLPTVGDIRAYAMTLPRTRHHAASIDAQPLMGTEDFIVTVQGSVIYGDNHKRRFFHRFTATKAPGSDRTFVSSDYMRWTGEG